MNIKSLQLKSILRALAYVFTMAVLSICLISCSKDDEDTPADLADEIGNLPGFGDIGGTPHGSLFKLPEGISIVNAITGGVCDNPTFRIGSGLLVSVCFELRNDTDSEISISFPAGLVFLSETDDYQHGVVLREESIRIPPRKTVRVALYTYCGNSSRSASDADASYTLGPITNSKLILRLINDLNGKKIDAIDYWDEDTNNFRDEYLFEQTKVQTLLWYITEGSDIKDWETFEKMYHELLSQIPDDH
ncbi:hypothetical protein [Sphingobacterium corticibacterium]|uniref:Uncharacterized protein n=1 Tax=Sphingobacterium corticibacterium TaxID=2484746 RepID=A0A4Q6XMS3_9SPHI|nr:hypothetical protein [Sphingobacterium corticibacterium]RZF61403.1 hypothetical protein EWE74_00740 [Sphingobacterium corticibacterium]